MALRHEVWIVRSLPLVTTPDPSDSDALARGTVYQSSSRKSAVSTQWHLVATALFRLFSLEAFDLATLCSGHLAAVRRVCRYLGKAVTARLADPMP